MPIRPKKNNAPDELMERADEQDALVDEQVSAIIPPAETPYNVKVLDALASAISDISKMMGIEVEVESYGEPTTTLDPDVARFLFMIDQAARDYGQPLPVALDEIRGDAELTTITAHLKKLAADEAFKDFLMGEEEDMGETEIDIEVKRGPKDEQDDMFMSRMA